MMGNAMTAEIAILNKTGIALAADSAVTIGSGSKTYDTANKLFMLSKHQPIGVMIFGGAELTGCPWEILIKVFREELGSKSYQTTKEYAHAFVEFIEKSKTISNEQQEKYFGRYIVDYFYRIRANIEKAIEHEIEQVGKIDDKRIKTIVKDIINLHHDKWNNTGYIKGASDKYCATLIRNHNKRIDKITSDIFQKIPIAPTLKKRLREIAVSLFCRDSMSPFHSGIVFAGYGTREIYPNLVSYHVDGIFNDKLKYSLHKEATVGDENSAMIIPFAQDEMVRMFMEGMDPNYNKTALGYIKTVLDKLPEKFLENISLARGQKKTAIKKSMSQMSNDIFSAFKSEMIKYAQENHIQPVMQAVGVLPKDELAKMAESLVNITSFKRKVTLSVESVGGPIDVAVISKGDGFVWVKRKHYFSPELNHSFFSNYFKKTTP